MSHEFVLPRPSASPYVSDLESAIPGPSEAAFTKTFGKLLPPATYVRTEVGRFAYYDIHDDNAPGGIGADQPDRVLLIHGVQTPALGMLPLARALRVSYPEVHFVLVDLWGHGLTDTPIRPHDASLFHQQIDDVLDHLNWPAAHFVGFSFGGALTAGYVASRPKRVQSFVLIAPAGLLRLSAFSEREQAMLSLDCRDEAAAKHFVIDLLEGGELIVPTDWKERVARGEVVAEALREWQMREHAGHAASVVAAFRDGGVMDNDAAFIQAARSGIPKLVVLGSLDDICSEEELQRLGFSDVAVVLGAEHGVVRERAPEVADLITAFWRRS